MMSNSGKNLEPRFQFSQSSLQDYADCPRRFQLRYIDQLQWPAIETAPVLENERRQIEGQVFHRMVQQYFLGLPTDKIALLAATENLKRWWENFLDHGPKFTNDALHTELVLSAPIGKRRIVAKYDLVAVKIDGSATIFDWKTSRKYPTKKWLVERLQTKVYLTLLLHSGSSLNEGKKFLPEQVEMLYWFTESPDKPIRITSNDVQIEKTWSDLERIIDEIESKQSYPMTEDEKLCSFCVYRSYCERGVAAGNSEELEREMTIDDINFEQIQEIEF